MRKTVIFFFLIVFCSCESESSRHQRVAEDVNIYMSNSKESGHVYHIDEKCNIMKNAASFKPISKRELHIYGDEIRDGFSSLQFCPACTKSNDIQKLKSQVSFYNKSK